MYQHQGSIRKLTPKGVNSVEERIMASLDVCAYIPNHSKYAFNIGVLVEKTNWDYSIFNLANSKETWSHTVNIGIKNTFIKRTEDMRFYNYKKSVELNYSLSRLRGIDDKVYTFHSITLSSGFKDLHIPWNHRRWNHIRCALDRIFFQEQIGR